MKYLYKNLVKKLSDYRLDHNKTCEDCKWYLEYTEVRKNTLFLSVKGLKKRQQNYQNAIYQNFRIYLIFWGNIFFNCLLGDCVC